MAKKEPKQSKPKDVEVVPAGSMEVRPPLMDRAAWDPVSLRITGEVSFDEWSAIGAWLEAVQGGLQWWTGDWMNYGEAAFDEKYAQAIDATGWSISTLEVYSWVCRKIAPAQRRPDLSFSHHKEVADLKPAEQETWLAKAITGEDGEAWSSDRLRRELKKAKAAGSSIGVWVVVSASDDADAEKLISQLTSEGRTAKRK